MLEKSKFYLYCYFIKLKRESKDCQSSFCLSLKLKFFTFLLVFLVLTFLLIIVKTKIIEFQQDDLTLVSSYYRIKSKHKPREYLDWMNNIVKINKSMVFYSDKKFMPHLKRIRPKIYHNKTVFNVVEIEDFFSYKNFINQFRSSWKIDFENSYHTVPLYLVWAEKCSFLKQAIENNYFNSSCFYWIDAGYFREKSEIHKYIENWPSTKKCFEDPRVTFGNLRNFSGIEKEKILNFDIDSHIYLQKNFNVAGNLFGGRIQQLLRFISLYYETIKLFVKNNIFIGKDQNIFTYIALSHPETVKFVYCESFLVLKDYLS